MPKSILFLSMCIIIIGLIFSLLPNFHSEDVFNQEYHWSIDILFHSGYYFFVSTIISFFFHEKIQLSTIFKSLLVLSTLIELIQLTIEGRSFSVLDLFSNTLGITLGLIIFKKISIKKNEQKNAPTI